MRTLIITKTVFPLLLLLSIFSLSCKKDYDVIDKEKIDEYLKSNGLTAQTTPSGLHYIITKMGNGERPSSTSTISVAYKGYFLDNKVFDSSDSIQFSLNQVIEGWREGLQLIQTGGSIRLFIPSALAYGPNGNRVIPDNEPLAFDITLKAIDAIDISNRKEIRAYAAKKNYKLDSLSSGLYYLIEKQGSGNNPTINSSVTVNYKGYFSDDVIFDGSTATFPLYNVIAGWQIGIPLFKKGGIGKLFVPSRLAYGNKGSGNIGPNKVILFDIELLDY
ncbi:MAG: FKBP-type peptidyl-prolyl cis-trans isomerase [Saprospiraceae bacterium]